MAKVDLYGALGVARTATPDEIRAAFREKSQTLHPDVGGGEEDFKLISLAKSVLLDPDARSHYDATGYPDAASSNFDKQVAAVIAQIVGGVADGTQDIVHTNVVSRITEELNHRLREFAASRSRIAKRRNRVEELLRRFRTEDVADPVGQALQSRLQALQEELQGVDHGERLHRAVIAAWELYVYEVDEQSTTYRDGGYIISSSTGTVASGAGYTATGRSRP